MNEKEINTVAREFAIDAAKKDADGHYMVKSITRIYNGKESGRYIFSYNALGKIIKIEDISLRNPQERGVLSWYGNKINYKQ